jgi:lipopolysaccharide transport system permease protein
MDNQTIIYEPNSRKKLGVIKIWATMFRNIMTSRELIAQLFKRDFLMAYKKSFIGMGWIFLSPIIGIVSWVFMNATGVLRPGDVGVPYPVDVLLSSSI